MTTGTLITVAPTGAAGSKAAVPALPVTIDELVSTAKECEALGAAVIHVHVRDDAGEPTLDAGRLRAAVAALRQSTDLIVQLSTGGAVTDAEADRLAVVDAGPEMASCAMGTVNVGDAVFLNRWDFIVDLHSRMQERDVRPAYEIADLGQLTTLQRLLDRYGLPSGEHVHVELLMGIPGGMPGTAAALVACQAAVRDLPAGTTVSASGLGDTSLPVIMASLATGGHLRVGLADTVNYSAKRAVESNMQLVARAVGFAHLAQRPPLTASDARTMLGLV
jgi:3-keto-5-aminohexanoate cleavage enzyme